MVGQASYTRLALDAIAETLWPTRCALCDRPGEVLCDSCARTLDFIDYWQACPLCGAPWGRIQCDHCAAERILTQTQTGTEDPFARHSFGATSPFEAREPEPERRDTRLCIGALRYTNRTATLVKTFKDKGEQRLAAHLAALVCRSAPPSWRSWAQCVTFVTATKAARRRRGFDHMELVARELAAQWGIPCMRLLAEPHAKDQRTLGRRERKSNMEGRFRIAAPPPVSRAIVIDDVLTTGATMDDACSALEAAGCACKSLVVARV